MRWYKISMFLVVGILVLPIFSILSLSLQDNSGDIFKWYDMIWANTTFKNAFAGSVIISLLSAILAMIISFTISLSWFDRRQRSIVLLVILVIGLVPPDIIAISINRISGLLGFYSSNLIFLIYSLIIYCLPFGILMLWSSFYFIENTTLRVAEDIGMRKRNIAVKIILPMSLPALFSCFTLCFLLAFNEFPRTFYLSGSYDLISQFLNGQLSSGTNRSIYAGSGMTVLLSVIAILILGALNMIRKNIRPLMTRSGSH